MVVTNPPLEYAELRRHFWQTRLETAERTEVKRAAGCFPSKEAKQREILVCRGAIQALSEIIDVEYS